MLSTAAHERHNPDLLRLMPTTCGHVVEVGASSGALAREYKKVNAKCHYVGVEVDPAFTELAARYCDEAITLDIERADEGFWRHQVDCDCWVFGDTLEHLRDPWHVLRQIRSRMSAHCVLVACIPNAQHWSLQVRLSVGDFFYQDQGLLDRTHLRWFTRKSLQSTLSHCGFALQAWQPRIFNAQAGKPYHQTIAKMAQLAGRDPQEAVEDCMPLQYVFRAGPGPV